MRVPLSAIEFANVGKSFKRILRFMFAKTTSYFPINSSYNNVESPFNAETFSRLFSLALCIVLLTLHSSISYPYAATAPHFAAVTDKIPVPHPQSSTRLSCNVIFSNSSTIILVVLCVPVPNAWHASIVISMGYDLSEGCFKSCIIHWSPIIIGLNPPFSHSSFQFLSITSSVSKEMEKVSKGKSSKVFSKDERSYSSFWMYPEIPPSFSSNDSYPTVPHKAAQISHAMEKDGPCIVFFPSVFFMKKTVL